MPDAAKIFDALAHAVKALGVLKVTAEEAAAMFQRLLDQFNPQEPKTFKSGAPLSSQGEEICAKAAERLAGS